jgi:KTSC domain-containing protein
MHPVESSAVAMIGYDAEREEAYVKYLDGGLYVYEGVPADVLKSWRTPSRKARSSTRGSRSTRSAS